jgi:glycosyltransferase involved in cell wall biosynthesis
MSNGGIIVNMRSQSAGLTGVQRYARQICARFGDVVEEVHPGRALQGFSGHLWEQAMLPIRVGGRLLWSPANTGPLALRRQVLTMHDAAPIDHPEWFGAQFAGWYRWLLPALARRVRLIITASEFSKRRLIEVCGADESTISVIPHGVDERFYPREAGEIREVIARLQIPSAKYVLSLASIEPRKNLPRLLEAWSMITPRLGPEIWLVIAGAAGKRHIFREMKLAPMPPRVHWAGFVDDEDLPALYSGALLLAYPSLYEGFGLPVLEAMATGTVPIVGRDTAPAEVAGDVGLLVDVTESETIAEAIVKLVEDDDLREDLRKRSLARSRGFTWECAARATLQVLNEASGH